MRIGGGQGRFVVVDKERREDAGLASISATNAATIGRVVRTNTDAIINHLIQH